jgi:hypothetical protein
VANLITWDFFRAYVGETRLSSTAEPKSHVELAIATASRLVEDYLGRPVIVSQRTELYDVADLQASVLLRAYPVTAIASIHNDPAQSWVTSALVPASDYSLRSEIGRVAFDYPLIEGKDALRVVYSAGLVPDRNTLLATSGGELTSPYGFVANAVAQQTQYMLARRESLGSVAQNTGRGRSAWSGPAGLLEIVKLALDPIRSRRITG